MKHRVVFGALLFASVTNAHAASNVCVANLQARYALQKSTDTVRSGNESVILEGSREDQAVVLVHGFIGSPFEVRALGEELWRRGATVVMPLLPGFGRSTADANAVTAETWRAEIRETFLELSRCYARVSLAGFSLGGTVVTDLALNDSAILPALGTLTLISPALRLKNPLLLDLLLPFRFLIGNQLEVRSAARMAKALENGDLDVPYGHPEAYNSAIPLRAVHELRRLGRKIRFRDFIRVRNRPVTFVFSDFDKTVNARLSWRKANRARPQIEKFEIPSEDQVHHQVLVSDENVRFADAIDFTASAVLGTLTKN